MASNFPASLCSEPFEITSQSGRRFYVHSDFLVTQSEPLRCTTSGDWKESTERKIDLSDWDDSTVGRFAHFLYSGDYNFPESTPEGDSDEEDEEERGDEETQGQDGPSLADAVLVQDLPDWERLKNSDTNVLLVHAKVYALAQYKDVGALRMVALERLSTALGKLPNITVDVIELLRYTYSHTDSLTNTEEPMRNLVSRYAAENIEKLMGWKGMATLLHEGGDFSAELMQKLAGRLYDAGEKYYDVRKEVQDWRTRATALDEKLQKSEAANAEKVRELETDNAEKVQELEDANAKIQELELAVARMRELEIKVQWWENVDPELATAWEDPFWREFMFTTQGPRTHLNYMTYLASRQNQMADVARLCG